MSASFLAPIRHVLFNRVVARQTLPSLRLDAGRRDLNGALVNLSSLIGVRGDELYKNYFLITISPGRRLAPEQLLQSLTRI
jgi:hypothetical protein